MTTARLLSYAFARRAGRAAASAPARGARADARSPAAGSAARLGLSRVRPHAVESLQRKLGGNVGMLRRQRIIGRFDNRELLHEPLRILEAERVRLARGLDAGAREPLGPERKRIFGREPPADQVDHPGARAPAHRVRILEE